MKINSLKISSYLYLLLPVIIFLVGWIKLEISIPICIIILICLLKMKKNLNKNENYEIITKKKMLFVFLIILVFCILAGQGGLFYQSNDHHWRNAILRDLIKFDWPVYYENSNCYLDYYIGHWMVPASIAKCFISVSESCAWQVGNVVMLLWSTLGVGIAFLWIVNLLKKKNSKNIFLALLIFIFFSGLDAIGALSFNKEIFSFFHIEWWAGYFQFSSITTQLFWVFNQSIVAWIITMMFFNEKSVKNYLLLIILYLPYAPFPFIGAIPLFACNGIKYLIESIKNKKTIEFFKDVFSLQNIVALLLILPIYYLYYNTNSATSSNGIVLIRDIMTTEGIALLISFWILEIGIYGILIYEEYKKDALFWVSFLSLIIIPLFSIGGALDFAMRGSIPCLTICMFYVIDFLINKCKREKIEITKNILVVLLIIGAVTPIYEYSRGIKTVINEKNVRAVADDIITFSDKNPEEFANFLAESPQETSIFFKYIAK